MYWYCSLLFKWYKKTLIQNPQLYVIPKKGLGKHEKNFTRETPSYQLGRGHIKPIILDRGVRFGYKISQIVPKWGKSVTFSDQISVNFGSKMYWNLIWKCHGFVRFGAKLNHFGRKSDNTSCTKVTKCNIRTPHVGWFVLLYLLS